ncbi:hypothetical protein PQX77_021490 [Marasmius sp. AFHP31]|nr:hypothetical protein PQX77_021490 [Marasmius sp. AFHP31]
MLFPYSFQRKAAFISRRYTGELPKFPFRTFRLDNREVEDLGTVSAVNEAFKWIFGWKARTTGDCILSITERGPDICAAADVLEKYIKENPTSSGGPDAVLLKRAEDIANGCIKAIKEAGLEVPDLPARSIKRKYQEPESLEAKNDGTAGSCESKTTEELELAERQRKWKEFRNLELFEPNGSKKGRKTTNIVSRLCIKYVKTSGNQKNFFGCVSAACNWLQQGNASKPRILKHAVVCKHLSSEDKQFAIDESAKESLGELIDVQDEKQAAQTTQAPSLAEFSFKSTHMVLRGPKLKTNSVATDCTNAGRGELKQRLDFAIMKVICVGGMCPTMLDKECWKEIHILKEAARIHKKTVEILQGSTNNLLTFDSNDTRGRESVYTTHYTTPDRRTFLFNGYEATEESHTGEWVKDIIVKTVNEVGAQHVSAVCSDSAANVKLGKQLAKVAIPTLITLPDCCHHINLMIKDITKLLEFGPTLKTLKKTIAFFSESKFSARKLKNARKEEDVSCGLTTVGKTRFASHYTAAESIDQCFPITQDLVVDNVIKIKDKNVTDTFKGQGKGMKFQLITAQYSKIIGPMARSIWQLEAILLLLPPLLDPWQVYYVKR